MKPSPTSLLSLVNLSLSNEQDKDESGEMSGLIDTQHCTTHKTLATVIGTMITNTLKYGNVENHVLVIQFCVYFEALGWKTEDYMTASAGTCLPDPTTLVSDENKVGIISPVIQLTIERIAQFVMMVRRRKLYLSKSTTFDELLDYHASNRHTYQRKYDAAALSKKQSPTEFDQKVPVFSVPKFVVDSLEGQKFVDKAVRNFKGCGQISYLEDAELCDNHPAWSEAFSSRLLDSLVDSDIHGYLSTKLKDEGNCAEF